MKETLKKSILHLIFQTLRKENVIVFLFGSHARGEALLHSDLDIGLLSPYKIPAKDFLEVEEALNNHLPTLKKIDLIDFASMDKKVREEALKEIQIWHAGKNCRALLKHLKRL